MGKWEKHLGITEAVKSYRDLKEKYTHKVLYVSKNGEPIVPPKKRKRKKPWYMLSKEEIKAIDSKRPKKTMGNAEQMEAFTQNKLAKWISKNPCPVEQDGQKDLFENEYLPAWKEKRDEAIARIRDFVVAVYDRMPLSGRYELAEGKFTQYEHVFAVLKDRLNEVNEKKAITQLEKKSSRLLKLAQNLTDKEKKKHPTLVAANLLDHKREKGVLILPKAA